MKLMVTESMIDAALDAGAKRDALSARPDRDAIRAMLQAALALVTKGDASGAYPLEVVGPTRARLRARFVRMGQQRGYMVVETNDGQTLNIHANEVFSRGGAR